MVATKAKKNYYYCDNNVEWRIKKLRLEQGLTQRALAALSSITANYLSRIEKGARTPSYEVLVDLARALNTTTDYLGFGKGPKFSTEPISELQLNRLRDAFGDATVDEIKQLKAHLKELRSERA